MLAKRLPRTLAALTLTVAVAAGWPGGVGARKPLGTTNGFDHFECYRSAFRPQFDPVRVRLDDQFSADSVRARVLRPNLFCNPVRKVHDDVVFPIVNPNNHLKSYVIESAEEFVERQVEVNNQFGTAVLHVVNPARLLVPTRKFPHDRPSGLDHYKCYGVQGDPLEERVRLRDQFTPFFTTVLEPMFLCNPAEKTHGDRVTPVRNPALHLVCYSIASEPLDRARQPVVDTRNQIGREEVRAVRARLLCAPTTKLD
jgi:hypothetical protein